MVGIEGRVGGNHNNNDDDNNDPDENDVENKNTNTSTLAEKVIKARTKLENKRNKARKLRELVANRVAEIRSSGFEDPGEKKSLDATAVKESLIHQCIKRRSNLMQQMKKEISSNSTTSNSNKKTTSFTASPSSSSKRNVDAKRSQVNNNVNSSDDDDEDEDDDDDELLFSPGGGPLSSSTRRKSAIGSQQQQQQQQSFSSFAKEFLNGIISSDDRERELFQGKVAVLESKMRIIKQLESECAEIPLLEQKLRAATKRI